MNRINEQRLKERIRINSELNSISKQKTQTEGRIQNYRSSKGDEKFIRRNIDKLSVYISEYDEKITNLTARLEKLEAGELDKEMFEDLQNNTRIINEKNQIKINAKKIIREEDKEVQKKSKEYYIQGRQEDKKDKSWYYNSAYNHFNKSIDTLPDYIAIDLKRMPCNQGYVWRNVYFFGQQPKQSETFKVTENKKGYKIIHLWNKDYEKKYKKYNKTNKIEEISYVSRWKNPN